MGTGVGVAVGAGIGVAAAVCAGCVFCLAFCGVFPLTGAGGASGVRLGFRNCSMISGDTPPLVRRITSGVDKSKLVFSAARI